MHKPFSLQSNTREDPRFVSANRDVAHNFKFVVEDVARRLTAGRRWDKLETYLLKPNKVTDEQLGEACKCFILFVAGAVDSPEESMLSLMERSGFLQLPGPAQIAYLAMLGQAIAGIYFNGAREATLGGIGPCNDMATVIAAGREASEIMAAPKWVRSLCKLKIKLRKAFHAFTGKKDIGQ